MKRTSEATIHTGLPIVGWHRISSAFSFGCLLLLFSCEIEDDFGKPDFSTKLGTLIYTSAYNPIYKTLWSEETNTIVSLGTTVAIIDVNTKTSKLLSVANFSYDGNSLTWLVGNTLYYLNYSGRLSSIDITDGEQKVSLADSILSSYNELPYSRNHVAFNKWEKVDPEYEPYLYLYDIETQKENLIASGSPIVFSPDGQYLLFSKFPPPTYTRVFYSYSIQTKAIETLAIQDPYGYAGLIKWTAEGILFYYQNYSGKLEVFNGSTHTRLGEWLNTGPIHNGMLSPSGKKIMTFIEKCANRDMNSMTYCEYYKQHYYVVDLPNNKEVEMTYGSNMHYAQFAFSPDEKRAVYNLANEIYLLELTE